MLSDVGHVIVVLVQPCLPHRVPEQRFEGSGRAGGDNDAVEPVFLGHICDFFGTVRGAREKLLLGIDHIWQGLAVFDGFRNIHNSTDVCPTMTYKDAYPGLLSGDVPFRRVDPLLSQLAPAIAKELPALGASPAGGENRLGNVCRALERSTHKDAGPGRLHRIGGIDLAEAVSVELNAEFPRQALCVRRRVQPHGQHHHIEFLLPHAIVGGRVSYGDILGFWVLSDDGGIAPDESNPRESLCPRVEPLKVLAEGTNVVVEYRTLCFGIMLLGQDDLFLGIGAAYG